MRLSPLALPIGLALPVTSRPDSISCIEDRTLKRKRSMKLTLKAGVVSTTLTRKR